MDSFISPATITRPMTRRLQWKGSKPRSLPGWTCPTPTLRATLSNLHARVRPTQFERAERDAQSARAATAAGPSRARKRRELVHAGAAGDLPLEIEHHPRRPHGCAGRWRRRDRLLAGRTHHA